MPYPGRYSRAFACSVIPYPLTQQVALRLPCPYAEARGRAVGLTTFPGLPTSQRFCRDVYPVRACLSCGRTSGDIPPFATGVAGDVPFWFWPVSRFGQSILTQVQSTVHVSCPFGTSLAPPPPSCWQIPRDSSQSSHAADAGDVVQWASHTVVADHACHRRLPSITRRVMTYRSRGRMTRQTRVGHPMTTPRGVSQRPRSGGVSVSSELVTRSVSVTNTYGVGARTFPTVPRDEARIPVRARRPEPITRHDQTRRSGRTPLGGPWDLQLGRNPTRSKQHRP